VKQGKNIQTKQEKFWNTSTGKQTAGETKRVRNTRLLREPPNNGRPPESPDRHLAKPEKQAITRTRGGRKGDPRRVQITRRPGES